MKYEVYVCQTSYHLYQTLILSTLSKKKSIIILTDFTNDLYTYKDGLINLDFIDDVIIFRNEHLEDNIKSSIWFKKILFAFNFEKSLKNSVLSLNDGLLDLVKNAEFCNIFVDESFIGRFVCCNSNRVRLYDDGEANYFIPKRGLSYMIKHFLFNIPLGKGQSDNVIEINYKYPHKVKEPILGRVKEKLRVFDLSLAEKKLSKLDKESIIDVFVSKEEAGRDNSMLLFTQPFSEDGFIDENRKLQIYKEIVEEYQELGYSIYIKPHPRETTNYFGMFSGVECFPSLMPSEVMNLYDKDFFDLGVAIQSTAINNANFIKDKINLGYSKYPDLLAGKEKVDNVIV